MNTTTSKYNDDVNGVNTMVFNCMSLNVNNDGFLAGADNQLQIISFKDGSFLHVDKKYTCDIKDAVIVRRYNKDCILIVSGKDGRRELVLWSIAREQKLAVISLPKRILNVLFCHKIIVVILQSDVYIFSDGTLTNGHLQAGTPDNPDGLAALSPDPLRPYLALPDEAKGMLRIFNVKQKTLMYSMDCHDVGLRCMTFNVTGELLATTSIKGDVVNVFEMESTAYKQTDKFKRGTMRNVVVYSLNFSRDSEHLVLTSDSKTVHIFKLAPAAPPKFVMPPSEGYFSYGMHYLTESVDAVRKYGSEMVPHAVADSFTYEGSVAKAYLKDYGMPTIATLSTIEGSTMLVVVNNRGMLYIYPFDKENPSSDMKIWRQEILTDVMGSQHFCDSDSLDSEDELNGFVGGTAGMDSELNLSDYDILTDDNDNTTTADGSVNGRTELSGAAKTTPSGTRTEPSGTRTEPSGAPKTEPSGASRTEPSGAARTTPLSSGDILIHELSPIVSRVDGLDLNATVCSDEETDNLFINKRVSMC